ncbi:MAG: hypothetical protein GXP26_16200 [Planctomycetes bacterium]|nr:hypothetical protein [Planctomycetota bacterium]
MTTEPNNKWVPVLVIAAALAIWGVILAVGAYLAPGGTSGGHDGRKLLVVAATIGGFLLLWGSILMISASKQRRLVQEKPGSDADQDRRNR